MAASWHFLSIPPYKITFHHICKGHNSSNISHHTLLQILGMFLANQVQGVQSVTLLKQIYIFWVSHPVLMRCTHTRQISLMTSIQDSDLWNLLCVSVCDLYFCLFVQTIDLLLHLQHPWFFFQMYVLILPLLVWVEVLYQNNTVFLNDSVTCS